MMDWLLLIAGALLAGAGLPMLVKPPFSGAVWGAGFMVGLGILAGVAGLWRLMRAPVEADTEQGAEARQKMELGASEVSALVLHVLEQSLDMLRLASSSAELDEIEKVVLAVQTVASRLGAERDALKVTGAQAREALGVGRRLAAIHRKLLEDMGRDPADAGPTLTPTFLRMELKTQVRRLEACSSGLAHLSRQFEDRPQLREGLTSAAQSVRMYLKASGARLGSSQEEMALAPTVRLPDLPLLEKVRAELAEIERGGSFPPREGRERVESARIRLEKLADAAMPMGTQTVQPIVQAVSTNLRQAAQSLERGEVGEAARQVDEVLKTVRAEQ